MTTKVTNAGSVKEQPISGGATVNAGQMYVNGDSNAVIVAPVTETATSSASRLGISSSLKTIDLPARVGAFSDTGKPIFEVI